VLTAPGWLFPAPDLPFAESFRKPTDTKVGEGASVDGKTPSPFAGRVPWTKIHATAAEMVRLGSSSAYQNRSGLRGSNL